MWQENVQVHEAHRTSCSSVRASGEEAPNTMACGLWSCRGGVHIAVRIPLTNRGMAVRACCSGGTALTQWLAPDPG